jgi:anti-sigma factor RsiW
MTEDDAELVALLDNELDEISKSRLLARLQADEALNQRYEALRAAGAPIAAAFDALLETAPVERLTAALRFADQTRAPAQRATRFVSRELAAGIAIGLLVAGAAASIGLSFAPHPDGKDWRAAIVEYMSLYNADTFALANPDAAREAEELRALSAKVGSAVTPENVTVVGLRFKTAAIFAYDGKPLGQIAYVDAIGAPVLFCVIADAEADVRKRDEVRGDLSLSSWSRGGRGYMVIGRLSEERVAGLASTLERRF